MSARSNRDRDAFSLDERPVIALYRGRNLKRRGGGNLKFVSDRTDIACHDFGESGYDWIRRKRRSLIAFRSPCHIDETRAAHLCRVRGDFEDFLVATAEIKSKNTKQSSGHNVSLCGVHEVFPFIIRSVGRELTVDSECAFRRKSQTTEKASNEGAYITNE